MILSDKEMKARIIKEPRKIEEAKEWWNNGEWDKIGDNILVDPLKPENMSVCSYDLSVGEEYVSLRDPQTIKKLKKGEAINVDPGENVLILTQEYIALPKNLMAMVVPRARWIFEGTSLNATRVDATWYGKLLVGFTNQAKNPIFLRFGEPFCTCHFIQTTEVENPLTKKDVPYLGRISIDPLHLEHARPQALLTPEEVTREHLLNVVKTFGYPWDIARGAIERSKGEIIQYVEKDVAPHVVEDAASEVTRRAYNELMKWHKILITGVITILVSILVAVVIFILTRQLPV